MSKDVYSDITARIIEQLEKGVIPWRKPWTGINSGAISYATGRPYSIINQIILDRPGEYITFGRCKQEGGRVNKGAKHKDIYLWKVKYIQKKTEDGAPMIDENGQPVLAAIPYLRTFAVFHIADCTGIQPHFSQDSLPATASPDETAEHVLTDYISRENIKLESIESDRAYYSPSEDLIHLPLIDQFENTAEYYGTAFHEATHSTGHKSRLNRFDGTGAAAAFGSTSYSKEELVAEIGAASILNTIGLETKSSFNNSAAYIQSWLNALKNDKRMIVSAAARAEKAVKLILNVQETASTDPESESTC